MVVLLVFRIFFFNALRFAAYYAIYSHEVLSGETVEKSPESRDAFFQIGNPSIGSPDFDANCCAYDQYLVALLDPKKLAEAIRDEQSPPTGNLDASLSCGKQPSKKLQFVDPAFEFASADFPPHQIHTCI